MVGSVSDRAAGLVIRLLGQNETKKNSLLKQLASGERSFSDDAAAGAISAELDTLDKALGQGTRNTADFVSIANLREAAFDQVSSLRERQAELASQAANGVYSDDQRSLLNEEFQQLEAEISRIEATTEFNGINLFSGTPLTAQVGTDSSSNSQIALQPVSVTSPTPKNILTQSSAQASLDTLKVDQANLSAARSNDGASVSRLQTAAGNNESTRLALAEASARLRDVDIANAQAQLVSRTILSESQTAILAQANQSRQSVLNLLR